MTKNEPSIADLDTMSANDLSRLPGGILQGIQSELDEFLALSKARAQKFFDTCELRYGPSAREMIVSDGREAGTVHVNDGNKIVDVVIKKSVSWDQKKLADLWDRIHAAGDVPEVYIKRELTVSESNLKSWPEAVQETFLEARTVRNGKPTYRIKDIKS